MRIGRDCHSLTARAVARSRLRLTLKGAGDVSVLLPRALHALETPALAPQCSSRIFSIASSEAAP